MRSVAAVKRKKTPELSMEKPRPNELSRPPRTAEAATQRREFASLMRSIKKLVHQLP